MAFFDWLFPRALAALNTKVDRLMGIVEDIDAAVAGLNTGLDEIGATLVTIIAKVDELSAAGGGATPAQLQEILDGLNVAAGKVASVKAQEADALDGPPA